MNRSKEYELEQEVERLTSKVEDLESKIEEIRDNPILDEAKQAWEAARKLIPASIPKFDIHVSQSHGNDVMTASGTHYKIYVAGLNDPSRGGSSVEEACRNFMNGLRLSKLAETMERHPEVVDRILADVKDVPATAPNHEWPNEDQDPEPFDME